MKPLLKLAVAALLMTAVLVPSAAASPSADLSAMLVDLGRDQKLTPCRFTATQLKHAQQQISGDVDAYAKGIRPAIKRELKRWKDHRCKNKRGYAKLKITKVRAAGEAAAESITIKNIGRKTVNLRNYALRDRDDHVLRLRSTKLNAGSSMRVVTGCRGGSRRPGRKGSRYYVCKTVAVWDDAGDLVELLGPGGGLISKRRYGTPSPSQPQ